MLDTNVSIGNDVSITNMYGVKESDRADTGGFIIQVWVVKTAFHRSQCCDTGLEFVQFRSYQQFFNCFVPLLTTRFTAGIQFFCLH